MHSAPEEDGNELADDLYGELRAVARRALSRSSSGLDPTDLAHQAWLRLSEKYENMPRVEFLALCATIIRRLAIDEARRRASERRAPERITFSGIASQTVGEEVEILELEAALQRLREIDERWARIVELRYFGGLITEEVAEVMGISRRTVVREWALARAWLKRALT